MCQLFLDRTLEDVDEEEVPDKLWKEYKDVCKSQTCIHAAQLSFWLFNSEKNLLLATFRKASLSLTKTKGFCQLIPIASGF